MQKDVEVAHIRQKAYAKQEPKEELLNFKIRSGRKFAKPIINQ